MDRLFEFHVDEGNDFFRVVNAIQAIENGEDPDLEKIKILCTESTRLYTSLRLDKPLLIKGFKWKGTEYIIKEMEENELIGEVEQSLEKQHIEQAITNLEKIAIFYKKQSINAKIYHPYFQFTQELLKRVVDNPRIKEIYTDNLKSEDLLNELHALEVENDELKKIAQNSIDKMEQLKKELTEKLLTAETFMLMGKIFKDNLTDEKLIRTMIAVQLSGGTTLKELLKDLKLDQSEIRMTIDKHRKYFNIDDEGNVTLNLSHLPEFEKPGFTLENIEEDQQGMVDKIKDMASKINFLKKKNG